jgi:hypothetical protein
MKFRAIIPLLVYLAAIDSSSAADVTSMKKNPVVGAYYYPWYQPGEPEWGWAKWKNAMRLHLEHPQQPMAGLYDSRDPEVIGAHIAQSLRGGIDFWSVSWWGPGSKTDEIFRNAVLKHPDSHKIQYAILYESTGRFGKFSRPDYSCWLGDLRYLKATYFDDPRYLKIDGRPVLFVYLSREYFRDRGGEALDEMRRQFPEIYLVGDDVFFGADDRGETEDTYKAEWAANFDAVTAYDVYGQSVGPFGGTQKAIDYIAANYAKARAEAGRAGTAFMPAIAPGYNDTAVREGHPGRARYFTDKEDSKEGDIFRAMIREVALPNLDPGAGNILMVTSFNEWYEDSQIEPTAGTAPASLRDRSKSGDYYTGGRRYADYGYLYLDILKEEIPQGK